MVSSMTPPETLDAAPRFLILDALRGIAAILVCLLHIQAWTSPSGLQPLDGLVAGSVNGVDWLTRAQGRGTCVEVTLFIVLSGACIHLPVASGRVRAHSPGFWREYAIRRATRIVPI